MNPATNVRSIIPYIGSLQFDGVDDALTTANAVSYGVVENIVLRARVTSRTITTLQSIIGNKADLAGTAGVGCSVFIESGLIRAAISDGANQARRDTVTGVLKVNTSFEITVVFNRSALTIEIYVDGVLASMSAQTGTFPTGVISAPVFRVGSDNGARRFFSGLVCAVRVLKTSITFTPEEVLNLFLHNSTSYDGNPAICVLNLETTANQIKGNQWLDKSGNNNHSTIVGPTFSYESPSKRVAQIGAQRQLDGRFDGAVSGGVTVAGGAMVFAEDTNRVVIGGLDRALFNQAGTFTVATWVRLSALPSSTRKSIWNFQDGGNNRISCTVDNNGQLCFARYDGAVYTGKGTANGFIATNTDYLVFCELNAGGVLLNVNLVNIASAGAYYAGPDSNNRFHLGFMTATNIANSIAGSIGAMIFNRTLTAEERTAIFNAGKEASCPVKRGLLAELSGRDWEGPAATPTKVFSVASWDGLNVQ